MAHAERGRMETKVKKFVSLAVVLFTLVGMFVQTVEAQQGSLYVDLDHAGSPTPREVLEGSVGVTLTALKFTVTGEAIGMEKLGLVFGGSNYGAISRITAWDGAVLVGEIYPVANNGTMILHDLFLQQDTQRTILLKADISRAGLGQPAQIGDTFSVNYEAGGYNPTVGIGQTSGMPIYSANLNSTNASLFTLSGPAEIPIAVTYGAVGVSKDSATLNGWFDSKGMTTSVLFQYGTDPGNLYNEVGVQTVDAGATFQVSRSISGLASGVTYYFRFIAKSVVGAMYGEVLSFTTSVDFAELNVKVVDSTTGQPFGQAWVNIWSNSAPYYSWSGWTDVEGKITLSIQSDAVLIIHAQNQGGHYAQYYGGPAWEDAIQVSLPATITVSLVPTPVYCYSFNMTDEKIGPDGGWVQYGVYLENRTDKPKKFVLWAKRSFPNRAPVSGSFYSGEKEEMNQREIYLAPGRSMKIYRRFYVYPSDPDGSYGVNFFLYNLRGAMTNGCSVRFVKGEDNTKG